MAEDGINKLARMLAEELPQGLKSVRDDLEKNFRSVLRSGLGKLDLVTREEFEVQEAVLAADTGETRSTRGTFGGTGVRHSREESRERKSGEKTRREKQRKRKRLKRSRANKAQRRNPDANPHCQGAAMIPTEATIVSR